MHFRWTGTFLIYLIISVLDTVDFQMLSRIYILEIKAP